MPSVKCYNSQRVSTTTNRKSQRRGQVWQELTLTTDYRRDKCQEIDPRIISGEQLTEFHKVVLAWRQINPNTTYVSRSEEHLASGYFRLPWLSVSLQHPSVSTNSKFSRRRDASHIVCPTFFRALDEKKHTLTFSIRGETTRRQEFCKRLRIVLDYDL